jgi:hypothetical protein
MIRFIDKCAVGVQRGIQKLAVYLCAHKVRCACFNVYLVGKHHNENTYTEATTSIIKAIELLSTHNMTKYIDNVRQYVKAIVVVEDFPCSEVYKTGFVYVRLSPEYSGNPIYVASILVSASYILKYYSAHRIWKEQNVCEKAYKELASFLVLVPNGENMLRYFQKHYGVGVHRFPDVEAKSTPEGTKQLEK